jgi:hypothetical protein
MVGVELTKVKDTHSGIHQVTPLNIDFGINNERQDCNIGTGWRSTCGRGRGNREDESEGIWLVGFIFTYEIE